MEEIVNISRQDKNWATACHLSAFASLLMPFFGSIIGPLVCWLARRDMSEWVDENGKKALNFQLSMALYMLLCIPLCIILVGIPILFSLWLIRFVCIIIASIKTANEEPFKYPLAIPFFQ